MAQPASQIVKLACTIAKGPGMVAMGGQMLNIVLQDLVLNRDLKMNRVTQPLPINATTGYGPYPLEADYLRTYDLFYAIAPTGGGPQSQGQIIILAPITMEQMDQEIKNPQISNYPYEFATDISTQAQIWNGNQAGLPPVNNTTPGLYTGLGNSLSAGQLFTYPATNGNVILTHRYMVNQPDIPTPETSPVIPWFPFAKYLITAVAAQMMGITGDDRKPEYEAMAEHLLAPYLVQHDDEQQTVKSIRLDPRHFRTARGVRNTKQFPF